MVKNDKAYKFEFSGKVMETVSITKPSFREVGGIINLEDVGLTFNNKRVGPKRFFRLRNADYGNGFRMPTIPELVDLVYASLENQEYESAKNVVETLRSHWLIGNTGILRVPEGMFVQDNPEMIDGRISMEQKTLIDKLGSHVEKEVVFSDNRSIRFVPYGFKEGEQTPLELSKNSGIIAFVDGEKNAEKIAKASKHYELNPDFWVLTKVDSPKTKIGFLGSSVFGDRLYVETDDSEHAFNRCSFGVRENYNSRNN